MATGPLNNQTHLDIGTGAGIAHKTKDKNVEQKACNSTNDSSKRTAQAEGRDRLEDSLSGKPATSTTNQTGVLMFGNAPHHHIKYVRRPPIEEMNELKPLKPTWNPEHKFNNIQPRDDMDFSNLLP
ncbi:uncharacterized protein LOC106154904 [Lingula anatina]|uniref:Uncharacterized protein LOC106154904 n=1 Tax=Lingula anatina TaxID=7574 RepID=A0A1S3HFT1_LINAN|nr:uncharacterized protein LOC106154904 [Lingula anatina]|eukprot:XP_013384912.1 uncharacterized protein LOC106154904 [Lingula anatina]